MVCRSVSGTRFEENRDPEGQRMARQERKREKDLAGRQQCDLLVRSHDFDQSDHRFDRGGFGQSVEGGILVSVKRVDRHSERSEESLFFENAGTARFFAPLRMTIR